MFLVIHRSEDEPHINIFSEQEWEDYKNEHDSPYDILDVVGNRIDIMSFPSYSAYVFELKNFPNKE